MLSVTPCPLQKLDELEHNILFSQYKNYAGTFNRSCFQIVCQETLGFHGRLSVEKVAVQQVCLNDRFPHHSGCSAICSWNSSWLCSGCTLGSCKVGYALGALLVHGETQKTQQVLHEQIVQPKCVPEPSTHCTGLLQQIESPQQEQQCGKHSLKVKSLQVVLEEMDVIFFFKKSLLTVKATFLLIVLTFPLGC